jgi:hypothetical protein
MGARAFLDFLAWTTFGLAQDYVGYDVKAPARDGSSLASTVFLHSSGGTAKIGEISHAGRTFSLTENSYPVCAASRERV